MSWTVSADGTAYRLTLRDGVTCLLCDGAIGEPCEPDCIDPADCTCEDLPERGRAALDLMAADVDRFQQLVEDLLEISRFDAGVAILAELMIAARGP